MIKVAAVTYGYIFRTFLKIGATTFGGFMALIAVVQRQVCEIDRRLPEEELLDGISLASVLPGPVAFNVVVYVGYKLRGIGGAAIAFIAILIPSFLLILLLSFLYFTYGQTPVVRKIFETILPVVTGLIAAVGYTMCRKQISTKIQWLIFIVAFLAIIFIKGYLTTLCVIIGGGLCGWLYFRSRKKKVDSGNTLLYTHSRSLIATSLFFVSMLAVFIIGLHFIKNTTIPVQIASVFSGMSLTLFGGGYVVIPTLYEMFVEDLHWLSPSEFTDGIAIGQMTPGPIFISASFIGYKVGGILGSGIATGSFFLPPALLMLISARFLEWLKQSEKVKAVFKGIRPAVIGMIFASVPVIGKMISINWISLIIFVVTIFLTIKYKLSPIYLILAAGCIGVIRSIL